MNRRARSESTNTDLGWAGGRRRYDLIREVLVAGAVVAVLVVLLSVLFASPDPPPVTMRQWAGQAPQDFVTTTLSEINGTSSSATYGPPYQSTAQSGATQGFGPISPEKWFGQRIPVDTFEDYVARPLSTVPGSGEVAAALDRWRHAPTAQQNAWSDAYSKAVSGASFAGGGYDVPPGDYGPLGTIVAAQYALARSGGLDTALLQTDHHSGTWYANDQTYALLYFGDSGQGGDDSGCIAAGETVPSPDTCWYYNQSVANTAPRHAGYLDGGTWGVVNEVGNWPGAWWLFPYSFWYQWGPGASWQSADLWAMAMTGLLSLLFLLVPWIPGIRDLPKVSRVHHLMWSDYYRLTGAHDRGA